MTAATRSSNFEFSTYYLVRLTSCGFSSLVHGEQESMPCAPAASRGDFLEMAATLPSELRA